MIERFKEAIDNGNDALLRDISKAFDCIKHRLLIAKLYNYGGSPLSINMIFWAVGRIEPKSMNASVRDLE